MSDSNFPFPPHDWVAISLETGERTEGHHPGGPLAWGSGTTAAPMASDPVADLCALARRYLTLSEREFAAAVAVGDLERADAAVGEAASLSEALKRQERSNDLGGWRG